MQTYNHQFEKELRALIDEHIEALRAVVAGEGIQDFARYKNYTGQISGLSRALDLCDQVNTKMKES